MEESALVVPVALPDALEQLRWRYDPLGKALPPHITLAVPFGQRDLRERIAPRLKELAAGFEAFSVVGDGIGAFSSDALDTIYLGLQPNDDLERLMQAAQAAFPEYPPYGGKHVNLVAHVTLARIPEELKQHVLARAQTALQEIEPVKLSVQALAWITGNHDELFTDSFLLRPRAPQIP